MTKKPIAGVEFEIRDKDGKVIETVVTDKDGHAESKELPICIYNEDGSFKEDIHYYVVETKAAEGYILDETVHDVVLQYCMQYFYDFWLQKSHPYFTVKWLEYSIFSCRWSFSLHILQ